MPKKTEQIEELTLPEELRQLFGECYFPNCQLAPYTTVGFGGVVEHLVEAQSSQELIAAARLAKKFHLPFAVVGGGSGILASEVGYPGVVIINKTSRIMFDGTSSQVVVDSGVGIDRLLNAAAAKGLGGLEFLTAVPGTIGGAVVTGAYFADRSIIGAVREIVIFVPNSDGGEVISVPGSELPDHSGERIFPESNGQPVLLSARLQFARIDQAEILRRLFEMRKNRHRILTGQRLGYVFNKPVNSLNQLNHQLLRLRINGAILDSRDLDVIVRQGRKTTADDFRKLINLIRRTANEQGIELEERVHYLGYWPDEGEDEQTVDTNSPDAESL